MSYVPSFVLKRISHTEILEKLKKGEFNGREENQGTISVANFSERSEKLLSNDPNSSIYTNDPIGGSCPVFVSTGQTAFDVYNKTGKRPSGLCDWCRRSFKHESVGFVVDHKKIICANSGTDFKIHRVFWLYGCYCKFGCAIADVKHRNKARFITHIFNYNLVEFYTRLLYSLMTGNTPDTLKPEHYWALLKNNGGSIDEQDDHQYIITNNVHLAPVKIFYERVSK